MPNANGQAGEDAKNKELLKGVNTLTVILDGERRWHVAADLRPQ